jgi:threonine aldolase
VSKRRSIDFRSDNTGVAAPEILAALGSANIGSASAYGGDDLSSLVQSRYSELFERPVDVFAVPTGTAANAMCLSSSTPPWGAIYCHASAHAHTSECGATEHFSDGAKFLAINGQHGKIDQELFESALTLSSPGETHKSLASTLTMTQATEWGTVYQLDELGGLAATARRHGLVVHLDGARFANAIVTLGCSPAEMTWRQDVDIMSFGVTKNGGLLCDAIVVFRKDLSDSLRYRLRRSGYGWSKMRFAAAQLLAYIEDDLWLRLAARANALATRLAQGLEATLDVTLVAPVEANEVFMRASDNIAKALANEEILVHARGESVIRLVCHFDLSEEDIDRCVSVIRRELTNAAGIGSLDA